MDVHIIQPPGPVPPVPVPHPFIGMLIDPIDFAPIIGATVMVNGMPRATAGTGGQCIPPHIPIGGMFVKPPANECEVFMGSATVLSDGDPQSFLGMPALSCHDVGMPPPPRATKKRKTKSLVLPTSVVLAVPAGMPVLIGGPPTISMMALGMRAAMAGLGKAFRKLRKTKFGKRVGKSLKKAKQKVFKNMKPGFVKCKVLKAEPVNAVTGEVVVEHADFSLPWRIPLDWIRTYRSHSNRRGVCGLGWETVADARLEFDEDGWVVFRDGGPGVAVFPGLPGEDPVRELADGGELSARGDAYRVRTKDGLTYEFGDPVDGGVEGRIVRISDRSGNEIRFVWGGQGLARIESAGVRIEVESESGLVRRMTLVHPLDDQPRRLVSYSHDPQQNLVQARDALGASQEFVYERGRLVRHTDRNGLTFSYEYDGASDEPKCVHSWGDGGLYDYRFEYEAGERLVTDSLGNTTRLVLDEGLFPVREIDPLGGVTEFEYDGVGRTTAVTDPEGHRTTYTYDEKGNLVELTRPDGGSTTVVFDQDDNPVATVDPGGAAWTQEWDSRGLIKSQTTPLGAEARFAFDSHGQCVRFTGPLGGSMAMAYDEYGNLVARTDELGNRTEFRYDGLGNVVETTNALGRGTSYAYDRKGRLVRTVLPSGATVTYGYDGEDNLTRYCDENGAVTVLEYCGLGELRRRINPDGHEIRYSYDTEERLVEVANQRGEPYRFRRDPLGRIVEETDYWGQSRRFAYTPAGHLKATADGQGRLVHYRTDVLGRILERRYPDPTKPDQSRTEVFEYDPNGNVIAAENDVIRIERTFDAEGRLVEERQGEDCVVQNEYDLDGNRVSRTATLGTDDGVVRSVEYTYDVLGQVVQVEGEGQLPISIAYDPLGQITQESLGPRLHRDFEYSVDGYRTSQSTAPIGKARIEERFVYNAAGNLLERRDSGWGTDRFTYDPHGRIVSHVDPRGRAHEYELDPGGDLLRTTDVFPSGGHRSGPIRTAEHDGVSYRFSPAGNVSRRENGRDSIELRWDALQRLRESWRGGVTTRYAYDPFGRRISKETSGRRTRFYWDGNALLGETTDRNEPVGVPVDLREWIHYPETFVPLAMVQSDGDEEPRQLFYDTNPNGSPTRLLEPDGGVVWAARTGVWGQVEELVVDRVENPLRLQGQYEDPETGLAYNRHRYFDSHIGAFTSQDPLGVAAGADIYGFAVNAFDWVDPLGLACGPAVRQNSAGRWIDAQGKFAKKPDVAKLPRLKGKSVKQVEDVLHSRGYVRTNPANPKNQRWKHPDGSEVQIHAYGNKNPGPYKSGNNAHAHKSLGRHGNAGTTELADDGATAVSTHTKDAHIGLRNPANFPAVAGRPHGT
ncbi:MAG: DUF6531 domain-containing protein [Gemmatimonadota bacterium]